MGKKKKKKNGRLPYVHIDVIPEEEVPPDEALPAGASRQGAQAQGPLRAQEGRQARQQRPPDYNQYPSEVISASKSGLAKQDVPDDDGELAPFVIPVFRKSDIQQAASGFQPGQQGAFPAGHFPGQGQMGDPRSSLARIQNNLLTQHNAAQQQASRQAMQPHQGHAHPASQQPYGAHPGATGPLNGGLAAQQAPQGHLGQHQGAHPGSQQGAQQSQGHQGASQQGSFPNGNGFGAAHGAASQGHPSQGMPARQGFEQQAQQVQQGHVPQQGHQGQQVQQVQQCHAAQGAQATQQLSPQQVQQAHRTQGAARVGQPTGSFSPVGAQASFAQQPSAAHPHAGAQPGAASTGTMQAVAAAAAARAEQARMHAAFGGVQAQAAGQAPYAQAMQGPRQAVQQAQAMQGAHPAGMSAQRPQAQQAQPHVQQARMQQPMGHQGQQMSQQPTRQAASQQPSRQAAPQQQAAQAPQAARQAQAASAAAHDAAKSHAHAGDAAAKQPDGASPSSGNVGDPLLDPKAIEESTMFDKPPVSIAEGMRKSDSGRKTRRRVIVIVAAVLVLLGAGVGAYLMLSQQGVVPQISIETKTVPVTSQDSSASSSSASSASSSSSAGTSAGSSGTGSGDLSGTVVYQYSANTASGVTYQVEETVSFQSNGDCQSSTMNMTFPDEASAKTFTDNLARDYGTSFKLDSLDGVNAVVTIDNSGLHLSRDEYENALRYSVSDLVVLGK